MWVRRMIGRYPAVVALALLSVVSACGTGSDAAAKSDDNGQVRLFGTDGNMSNSFGDAMKDEPGILAGMKGTTALTPLSPDFKRRLRSVDSSLTDFNYAGESYDAVVLAALAAEAAHSTDSAAIAKQVVAVTVGTVQCETVKACLAAIKSGQSIKYRGVSLRRSGLTDAGEPSTATYGTLNFNRDNHIDDAKTEFVGAGDEGAQAKSKPAGSGAPAASPAPGPSASTKPRETNPHVPPLKIGALLPRSGALAFQGPPLFAGSKLAIREINEAGGVLGQPVEWFDGDDGTSPQVAGATLERHIAAGVQVIIGAAASGIAAAVLPRVVAAGKVMISPSATSDALTNVDDRGLFFRTAPPDKLQAKALADIVMREGCRKVAVIARDDNYGTGFSRNVQSELKAAGLREADVKIFTYHAREEYSADRDLNPMFEPIGKSIKQFAPDGVVIIGYDESVLVIRGMLSAGVRLKS